MMLRNRIVIADLDGPLQSASGIKPMKMSADRLAVVDYVLQALKNLRYMRPLYLQIKNPSRHREGISRREH
jgi:hypothetical protein